MHSVLEELESLLFDWEAGTLDDAGLARAREILRSSEAARAFYIQQQILNAAIKLDVDAGIEPKQNQESIDPATPAPRANSAAQHVLRVSYWAAAMAMLLLIALIVSCIKALFRPKV